ncbi:MAG: bifunctional UDP-sugar hydrolase/5'-nucleotidase [Pseudomonadota bacterium]|nr:bifunctional UDP-sugar hydrolase/5'-nucleotidase [Pseudomonadota bacterium]
MILLLLAVVGCKHAAPEVGLPEVGGQLTILHTNDIHGHYLPEPAEWLDGRPAIGGWARLDAEVDQLRATRPRKSVLLFDAGDQLTGTPLTDLVVDGSRGGAMHAFFETVGYDAWAVGNHEFDKGLDNLAAYTESFAIVTLSANLRGTDGVSPLLPNQQFSHVFERSGLKVGVIGATTEKLAGLMSRADFARLTLLDVETAVKAEVERLDPVTDLIVLVSHIGLDSDERLARFVPGIDLIVGGHSHTPMKQASRVENTWIVQAGSYGRSLGVVDLVVSDDRITKLRYELRDLGPHDAPREASREITQLTEDYADQLEEMFGEELAEAPILLGRDYNRESPLGRWITDALRDATGADVAMYNNGGLRADILPGKVTRGTLFNCFPFGNALQTFEIRGADLQEVVLKNAIAEHDQRRGFLPLSGVTWTWRVRSGAAELLDVKVGASPLDRDRIYTVATNSYITEQWEKHIGVPPLNLQETGQSDYEAAVTYAKKSRSLVDPGDSRGVKLQ